MGSTDRPGRCRSIGTQTLAVLAALVLPVGWLGATADPAGAAFPGANGRIVFASSRTAGPGVTNPTGDYEIFTMNPDGSGVKQLTKNKASDTQPAWSPNGQEIAFQSGRDGNAEVLTISATGASRTNRTNDVADDRNPDWQTKPR